MERPRLAGRRELICGAAASLALGGRSNAGNNAIAASAGEPVALSGIGAGQWRLVILDGETIYLRRLTATQRRNDAKRQDPEWVALSARCPHGGCLVMPQDMDRIGFVCPCHGSAFSPAGQVLRGPALSDLGSVPHELSGQSIRFR